jgi:hypothetical protein
VWLSLVLGAFANETDNFFLPLDPEFADLGDYLELVHTRAMEQGVQEVNSRIERALNSKDAATRARQLAQWQTPDALAEAVAAQFGAAPMETLRIEGALGSSWARQSFPNQRVMSKNSSMNLRGHLALDPRALLMFFQAGTVKGFGVYFGTDKLLHFHKLGHAYFKRYRGLLRDGLSPEAARRNVLHYFSEGALLSEGSGFGTLSTGIYSNADMAANYAGFKFFLNLTDKVMLLGQEREPLVVRCGVFWRLNDHVRLHSDWLRPFITDHWNEALNPSLYDASMRPRIRRILQRRANSIVLFYTWQDRRPKDPAYFENLAETLSKYGGEPYGHSGRFGKLMNIGNTCIPALPQFELNPPSN